MRLPMVTSARRMVAVLVMSAIGFGAPIACSSFEASDDASADAAGDAPGSDDAQKQDAAQGADGAQAQDAGLVPTPGTFACFSDPCDLTRKHCCYADDGGPSCKDSCVAFQDSFDFQCDEQSDCSGRRCCVTLFILTPTGTSCETACASNIQLCATNEECPTGTTCVTKECRGRLVGTCGDVDVSSFCKAAVTDAGADARDAN